jgi:hypothetical protein
MGALIEPPRLVASLVVRTRLLLPESAAQVRLPSAVLAARTYDAAADGLISRARGGAAAGLGDLAQGCSRAAPATRLRALARAGRSARRGRQRQGLKARDRPMLLPNL